MLGELDTHLGCSFPSGGTIGPGVSLNTSLSWPGGRAMQAECSCFSYPSNAVLLRLCGPGDAYLTSGSGTITVVSCLWIVASWSSCKGD